MEISSLITQFHAVDPSLSRVYRDQRVTLLRRYLMQDYMAESSAEALERFFRISARRWSLSYFRKVPGAMSSFFDWAVKHRHISDNPMTGLGRAIDYSSTRPQTALPPVYVDFASHLRSLHRSEDTIMQRIGDMRRFAGDSDPLQATAQSLGDYLHSHRLEWSAEYRRKIRASFVAFYRWATSTGRIDADPTLDLASVRPGKSPRAPIKDEDLLSGYYGAPLDAQTVIALAASLGLRRTEIALLHTRGRSGRVLTIHGKGQKVRHVPLNDLCYKLLVELERYQGPGYYFRNERTQNHLHPSTIYKKAKRHIGSWCLHSLRHRAATVGLRRGANIRGVQELLGHASLSTTQIYTEVSLDDLAAITSSTAWPMQLGESDDASTTLTIDLASLATAHVPLVAEALSRYLKAHQAA